MPEGTIQSKMEQLKCCVIIPTYNNDKTLKRIIDGILNYTKDIIVVNDGSTDRTLAILNEYPNIEQIHKPENTGKGTALKAGFKRAVFLGFDYAITLDTDGQHFPKDIPYFVDALIASDNKNILIIGDRNMNEADVFAKSAKGNRVSTFWMYAATGLRLNDSQSGFRLYPIKEIDVIKFMKSTKKFEFEIEAIVKSYWSGTEIRHVPINVLYDPVERVSHFRPFMDISRMVILYTWFLLVRLFYITPRNLFRRFKKKGIKRFLVEDVFKHQDSPKKKALSIALGIFIGLSPLWGFHTIIVLFLAVLFRLNKVIAFTFSNVSLAPLVPFVVFLSLQVGDLVLGTDINYSIEAIRENFDVAQHLKTYLVGSFTFSSVSAIVLGLLSYLLLSIANKKTANG
ncbi:DUF2062 domain-containing protein [Aquimarina algiphila]|uniref:DUF2062 domain-containing protein n=1 Tax=Aquimarina algiphila TaxID=2047982 RepID=A0A554VEC3_9FLAO|nr:DUF2062 domain-containing protein [Aquimarina algiphila]TSE05358.1 DUF2062 domain-containing protein [Aquimarina algiphila]